MRILIADDHDLLRDVLKSYLDAEGGFAVGLARDVDSALAAINAEGPFDLTVLDFSMPGMNGFAGLQRVLDASAGRPVAIMSGNAPAGVAQKAVEHGAAGFLPKSLPARSVLNAIRFMLAGERYLPHDLASAQAARPGGSGIAASLTERERQVLQGLTRGDPNKAIARDLGLQEPTVKLHVKTVCRKLGARNRTHAAMIAREEGLC